LAANAGGQAAASSKSVPKNNAWFFFMETLSKSLPLSQTAVFSLNVV
jgi:hypothetical protein